MAVAGLWRRRRPVAFAAVVAGVTLLVHGLVTARDYAPLVGTYTVTVPQYSVGAWAGRIRAAGYLLAFETAAVLTGVTAHVPVSRIAGPVLLAAVAWCAGKAVRHERRLAGRFRQVALQLAGEEADHGRLAVIAERARLARDLHGLVAGQVSVMVVQAELAGQLLAAGQPGLGEAIEAVEQTGRAALAEMRATLGVMLAARTCPDVVLMDIRMPGINGIDATRQILARSEHPPRVLILTTFDLDEYIYDALKAGASGFLLKDVPPHQLAQAVITVGDGDALLSPSITRRLIEEFSASRAPRPATPGLEQLSTRELEVFRLLARGLSNHEIAGSLIVGETTVKIHVARILAKLGVRDRVQAVVIAYESGLISPGQLSLTLPARMRKVLKPVSPDRRGQAGNRGSN